ncbi:hypothetical protein ABFS83_05G048000 [Erythranthe nasuta]
MLSLQNPWQINNYYIFIEKGCEPPNICSVLMAEQQQQMNAPPIGDQAHFPRLLLGVTCTSQTLLIHDLVALLQPIAEVVLVCTPTAASIVDRLELLALRVLVIVDGDEFKDVVPGHAPLFDHVVGWADMMVIAPMSCNMVSKVFHFSPFLFNMFRSLWERPIALSHRLPSLSWLVKSQSFSVLT